MGSSSILISRHDRLQDLVPTTELEADITAFIAAHNEDPKPYRWVNSANKILASVKWFDAT
jgi:hypothetical protein